MSQESPTTAGLTGYVEARPALRRETTAPDTSEIASMGEFVDCLERLLKGHLLVCIGSDARHWTLDGAAVHWSSGALLRNGLIQTVRVPGAAVGVTHYILSAEGRSFGGRALARWRALPWWRRGLLRFIA